MYTLKPYFYDDFHCLGGACHYTCCGGWTIVIDKETAEKYKQYEGYLKKMMEDNLIYYQEKNIYMFQLNEKKMCPFCNEEQLCILIKIKGEQSLSNTCRMFPRNKFMTRETEEYYLSLGCPAVVSLLLTRQEPLSFILEDDGKEEEELRCASDEERKKIESLYEFIEMDMKIRNCMVDILQNREWPLWFREFFTAYCLDKIKEEHNQGNAEVVYGILKRMLEPYFLQTLKGKLLLVYKDEEKQFRSLRALTHSFRDLISGQMYFGRDGQCAAKVAELMNQNLDIEFEVYKITYDKWKQKEEKNFDILAEHIAAYTWMQYAMIAFTKYYMVDNYWDVVLTLIIIKYLCILQYSIYEKIGKEDIEFIVALVCRGIYHGRDSMKKKLNNLKNENQLSIINLFLLIAP